MSWWIAGAAGLLGVAIGWFVRKVTHEASLEPARRSAEGVLAEAEREARNRTARLLVEARRKIFEERQSAEAEIQQRIEEIARKEERLAARRRELEDEADLLQRKSQHVERRADELLAREKEIDAREEAIEKLAEARLARLEAVGELSREEVMEELRAQLIDEAREQAAEESRRIVEEVRGRAEREGRRMLALAVHRCAVDQTPELTVTAVELPSDDMKGRIIGKEGRNIRAFEAEAGVDVIIDDTPNRVSISAFDPERREVARLALQRLIQDGRIHPARIEDVLAEVRSSFEQIVQEEGERAAFEAGVYGLDPVLVRTLGRLKYRTLGGQNALQHVEEVSLLAGGIAAMLEADEGLVRRAGLLHELGCAVPLQSRTRVLPATLDLLSRHGESVHVLEALEGMARPTAPGASLESIILATADEISVKRPGARKEPLERYIQRLRQLEEVATSFPGVKAAYAVQAGRELRVMVEPAKVTDERAAELAKEMARRITREVVYPGSVRIIIIRRLSVARSAR